MPKIKLSNGVIKYKTHPLFLGVKKINIEIATENLILLKSILDQHNIKFGLIAGTLLGAIREKDFIHHDEDIDLFLLNEQRQKFLNLIPILVKAGFEIARYDRRGLLSIIRKGEYIDFYFFTPLCDNIRHCCGWCVPEFFLIETTKIFFKGEEFIVPRDYEGFLEYEYGYDWQTPVKWANFDISWWKRNLHELKCIIKEILPNFIFKSITKHSERKMFKKYNTNIMRYNERYGTSLKINNT